jgi:hypothetical protein
VNVLARALAGTKRLDDVFVLLEVAVRRRLVRHDRDCSLLCLLFLDVVLALAADVVGEKHLRSGVDGVDRPGVLWAEQLHREADAGTDEVPGVRRLSDH